MSQGSVTEPEIIGDVAEAHDSLPKATTKEETGKKKALIAFEESDETTKKSSNVYKKETEKSRKTKTSSPARKTKGSPKKKEAEKIKEPLKAQKVRAAKSEKPSKAGKKSLKPMKSIDMEKSHSEEDPDTSSVKEKKFSDAEQRFETTETRKTLTMRRKKSLYARKTITGKKETSEIPELELNEPTTDTIDTEEALYAAECEEYEGAAEEEIKIVPKRLAFKPRPPKKRKTLAPRRTVAGLKKKSIVTRKTIGGKKRKTDALDTYLLDADRELEEEYLLFLNEELEAEGEGEEEIRETGSSLLTDWSDDYELAEGEVNYLFESDDIDVDSSESLESEKDKFAPLVPHYYRVRRQREFFERLGHVPSVDQISITGSLAYELAVERGDIVKPKKKEIKIETAIHPAIESEESSEWTSSTEYSDIDYDFESSEDEVVAKKTVVAEKKLKLADESLFEIFIAREEKSVFVPKVDPAEIEAYNRLQEARQMQKDADNFLRSLIEAVVEVADFANREEVLRGRLDKMLLFRKMANLFAELQSQWKINDFLNAKCVMHYRRLRSFGQITPDKPENLSITMKKYKEAIHDLNCSLGKKDADKLAIDKNITDAEDTITELEESLKDLSKQLETLLRKTFHDRKSEVLNEIVEHSLKEMSVMREEISRLRCLLIRRQHINGILLEKIEKHEIISDKHSMNDYARMLDQQSSIFRKIKDKADRLEKLRHYFFAYTNVAAHIRDKLAIDFQSVKSHLEELEAAETERRNLRLYNHKLKLRRLHVSKQIQDYILKCGLLAKPALLIDYDATVEQGISMRQKVNEMKTEVDRMEKLILALHEKIKPKM